MTTAKNPWIVRPVPRPGASVRLFCFPHAGAGAAIFREWYADFPAHVEVCAIEPPGRLARRQERLITELPEFITTLRAAVTPYLDRPFAFFGYSLGALIAFELARAVRRHPQREPLQLIVAAARAPQLPRRLAPITRRSPAEFARELERRYGAFDPLIKGDPELFELVLEITRADMQVLESYVYADEAPLACPIVAIGGRSDPTLQPPDLEGWRAQTHGAFTLEWLPGGHFFLRTSNADLRRLVRGALAPVIPAHAIAP